MFGLYNRDEVVAAPAWCSSATSAPGGEGETGHPIPLGAILARRDLDDAAAARVDGTIRASLDFARADEAAVAPYVREHAFEMDEDVMRAHIALYVNESARDLGDAGIAAVEALFELASAARLIPGLLRGRSSSRFRNNRARTDCPSAPARHAGAFCRRRAPE